jgi:cohesin loading factor subunit SCC2
MDVDGEVDDSSLTEADFRKLARTLEIVRDNILAGDSCVALLGSDKLAKHV